MGDNTMRIVDPDGGEGEDWVLGADGYYWGPNIHDESQALAAGVGYVGETLGNVMTHFKDNRNLLDWFRGTTPSINYSSFYKSEFSPLISDILISSNYNIFFIAKTV
jgi:hypothetical protein